MRNLKTVDQAKEEIAKLQIYVNLVENFQPETLEEQILKEYAYLGSIVKVADKVNKMGFLLNGNPVEKEDVSAIIRSRGKNDLHKVLRTGYLKKTRVNRRKY